MRRIFLSYARSDDAAFTRRLFESLAGTIDVWFDLESMPSRALTFLQEIREAIDGSDRLIVVIGPGAIASDYVRAEWQYALAAGKVVNPVLRCGGHEQLPPELARLHCPDFRNDADWDKCLAELRRILDEPIKAIGSAAAVPLPPPHFQPRLQALSQLAEAILVERQTPAVLLPRERAVVLHGMGGVGKSVLAASLARSVETRRAFSDGIVWLEMGLSPDLDLQLETAAAQVGKVFSRAFKTADQMSSSNETERKLFGDEKHHLIVLDDVWKLEHIEPFLRHLGRNSSILITTRQGELATSVGGRVVFLDVLSNQDALRYLADWSGVKEEHFPDEAAKIAEACGYLPFGLALCGAMVRNGNHWSALLRRFDESDLEFLSNRFPDYPYPNLLRCLGVSLDVLEADDPQAAELFKLLAIFRSDEEIPIIVVLLLWQHVAGLDHERGRALIVRLRQRALFQPSSNEDRALRLHALQYDYLRSTATNLPAMHAMLLEAYREHCPAGWPACADDGYYFGHLAHHLTAAGWDDELSELISPEWMNAQFQRTRSHLAFAHDLGDIVERGKKLGDSGWHLRIRAQILLARIRSRATQVPTETLRGLAELGERARAAAYAELVQEDYRRARVFVAVAESAIAAVEQDEAASYLQKAVDAAEESGDEHQWASIAPLFAQANRTSTAFQIAARIPAGHAREDAYGRIAVHLARQGDVEQALTALTHAEPHGPWNKVHADVYTALVNRSAVDITIAWLLKSYAGDALKWAAPPLVEALVRGGHAQRAKSFAEAITDPWIRAVVSRDLAKALANEGAFDEAHAVADSIEGEPGHWAQHSILEAMVARGCRDRALQSVHTLEDPDSRKRAARVVVEALAATGSFQNAIEACHLELSDDVSWDLTLTDVIKKMKPSQIHECVDVLLETSRNRGAYHRRSILCTIVKQLSGTDSVDDLDKIRRAAEGQSNSPDLDVVSALLLAYARSNVPARACELLPYLEKASPVLESDRLRTHSILCLALVLLGHNERASEIFQDLGASIQRARPHAFVLSEVLRNVAVMALRTDTLDKWLETLDTISNEGDVPVVAANARRHAMEGLVAALSSVSIEYVGRAWLKATVPVFRNDLSRELFEACLKHGAFDIARTIVLGRHVTSRSWYLGNLFRVCLERKEWLPALATIESMEEYHRAEPLAELALAVAEQPDGALLESVEQLANSLERGRPLALSGVARAVLRRGDADSARQRIYALLSDLDKAGSDSAPWKRCRAAMIRALITSKRFSEALQRIDQLEDAWQKDKLRQDVSTQLVITGCIEDAIETAASMEEFNRETAMTQIALAFVARGDDSRALQVIASSGIREFGQGSIRAALIDELLEVGEADRATAMFEQAPQHFYQTAPCYAAGLTRLGFRDRALHVARDAESDTRGRVLVAIAEATYRIGDSLVEEIAREALGALKEARQADAGDVIRMQIYSGQFEEAVASARSIPGYEVKKTMTTVVTRLVDFGQVDRAMSLTEAIDEMYARADVRQALLIALVKRRDVKRAVGFADGLGRFDKAIAMRHIVRALAETPESIDDAIRIASEISEASSRAESLADCIVALLAKGSMRRVTEVLDLLGEVKDVVYRARSIQEILQQGDVDPATLQTLVTMARSLSTNYYRAETLGAAAAAWFRLGNVEEGLKMLDEGLDASSRSEWRDRAVYETLASGAPALSSIAEGATILSVYDAAVELDTWWP
jgi:tetratricopeptide (TPR) repeat protein